MKQFIALFLLMSLAVFTNMNAQTNDALGGAGISITDQDPDNVTTLQSQDDRYESILNYDATNEELYIYKGSQTSGVRWDKIDLVNNINSLIAGNGMNISNDGSKNFTITNSQPESTTVDDTDNVDLTINAGQITADVILDPAGDNTITTSSAGLKVTDELPSGGSNGDVLTTNGSGTYSWTTGAAGESTTVDDSNNISLTLAGAEITADVILDPDAGNILTTSATGLLVEDPQANLTVAIDHADAGTKGVPIGGTFEASTNNTMGSSPGQEIKRRY